MNSNNGYIAVSSVLVIAVIVLMLSTSAALLSVNTIQSSLATKKGVQALHLAEGCVEDVLLSLNETNTIPSIVTFPEGSCTVAQISQIGDDWVFDVEASVEGFTKSLRISASRSSSISITVRGQHMVSTPRSKIYREFVKEDRWHILDCIINVGYVSFEY